jgi:hypothetical protein
MDYLPLKIVVPPNKIQYKGYNKVGSHFYYPYPTFEVGNIDNRPYIYDRLQYNPNKVIP